MLLECECGLTELCQNVIHRLEGLASLATDQLLEVRPELDQVSPGPELVKNPEGAVALYVKALCPPSPEGVVNEYHIGRALRRLDDRFGLSPVLALAEGPAGIQEKTDRGGIVALTGMEERVISKRLCGSQVPLASRLDVFPDSPWDQYAIEEHRDGAERVGALEAQQDRGVDSRDALRQVF